MLCVSIKHDRVSIVVVAVVVRLYFIFPRNATRFTVAHTLRTINLPQGGLKSRAAHSRTDGRENLPEMELVSPVEIQSCTYVARTYRATTMEKNAITSRRIWRQCTGACLQSASTVSLSRSFFLAYRPSSFLRPSIERACRMSIVSPPLCSYLSFSLFPLNSIAFSRYIKTLIFSTIHITCIYTLYSTLFSRITEKYSMALSFLLCCWKPDCEA